MKKIDLNIKSDDDRQYYSIVIVSNNGQPLTEAQPLDSTYDVLQFTNFGCEAQIIDYLKQHYAIPQWKDFLYYKIFFHGTNNSIDPVQIYKKYHKLLQL